MSRSHHRGWAVLTVMATTAAVTSACGAQSMESRQPHLSPTQYDTAQRIVGYVRALNRIEAPFRRPPTEPTNYPKAAELLRTATAELSSLVPPPQFRASYAKLVDGFRRELATIPAFEEGQRTHSAIELNNAEARNAEAAKLVRAALTQGGAVLSRCKRANFAC